MSWSATLALLAKVAAPQQKERPEQLPEIPANARHLRNALTTVVTPLVQYTAMVPTVSNQGLGTAHNPNTASYQAEREKSDEIAGTIPST